MRRARQVLCQKTSRHGACLLIITFAGRFNRRLPHPCRAFLKARMGIFESPTQEPQSDGLRPRRTQMFEGLFQPMHLMIIAGIALLIFGPKKLPELGKGLGESIRGFKAAMAAPDEEKRPAAKTGTTRAD